jgi:hypothetical protein
MIHMKTILFLTVSMLAIAGWSQSAESGVEGALALGSPGCAQHECLGGDVQAAGPA